jgi:hypothetical protein
VRIAAAVQTGRGGCAFRPFCVRANPGEKAMGRPPATVAATETADSPGPPASAARRWVRWTELRKGRFLDHLAISGNVTASAALIGVRVSSVYALRRRDAGFARDWQVAVESGYQLLETLLLGHVLSGARRDTGIAAPDGVTLDMDAALRLLAAHRGAAAKRTDKPAPPGRDGAAIAQTDAAILRKLNAIDKRRGAA